ncbi:MAG: M48 family metalloprotease [Rickettsiales bacterium]|nr:M48 family metalloprotease [Rickettsiales bacterium]
MRFIVFIFAALFCVAARAASEIRDTEIEAALGRAIAPLATAAKISPKIHIVGDNGFNAFTAGGADIFINTGLIVGVDNWAELQAVAAHEIGHATLGHMAQMAAKIAAETARTLVMQALGIGLIALNPNAAIGVMAGAGGIATQSMLAFTRDEERAADDYAAKLLERADIDPSALLSVFKKMQSLNSQSKTNPNNVGHPLTEERIRNIKLAIETSREPRTANRDLKLVQAKLIGYLEPNRVASLYPAADKSDPAIYARAIMRMRAGDLATAKVGTNTLTARHPDGAYFYELLGDINFQAGDYDASAAAYEKSLALTANAPQIETALALVLAERNKSGDRARAMELARRALLAEKTPLAFWVMARADPERGDYYMAEYYQMTGARDKARASARAALKRLTPNTPEYIKARDLVE